MPIINITNEAKRGCGFRKKGGLYLVSDGLPAACGRLPIPLAVCPTCGHGIKPARGWTWICPQEFSGVLEEQRCEGDLCDLCPVNPENLAEKAGLLWIGERFYKTPQDWAREAVSMGISRRIPSLPHGFELGKTFVWIAHRKAISRVIEENGKGEVKFTPGVFHVFQPQRVEYIVTGEEAEEELERMEKRGITLIRLSWEKEKLLFEV